MPRSSEDFFFAVLAVTLQKASQARNRKLFLAEISKEVSSARRGNFKEKNFIRRACHLLNQRLMPKRRPKFVKPRLPFFLISG